MFEGHEHRSEVAHVLSQIRAEYEAAQRGLSGLACGAARHDFITARTEHIGSYHEKLVELVGPDQAISIMVKAIWSPADQSNLP